ncbi:hypothetical protein AJ78_01807 [Emergomyces pasteurianus Ep9510]|uniref:Uncharacterized protein n=1 Tax=Emergomyces pasteurianus Ep9510 TaxID=1447872 RepID=A0A1J9QSA2_9EURO|nr:hypothetical protein AJ78_01807 [Emergomyces pasteurianus Ep9510]
MTEKRAQHKLLFRSSRESYSDDDSGTNKTPVASIQQEEEVLYEIDPRALEKLPERLQNNYCQIFEERVERLSQANPNFKYRQYDYMDYWPEDAFGVETEAQPRYMKRRYPRKHKVLQELGIMPAPQLPLTNQKGPVGAMNADLSSLVDVLGQDTEKCKDNTGHTEEKETGNSLAEKVVDKALVMLFNAPQEKSGLVPWMREELHSVTAPTKSDSHFQALGVLEALRSVIRQMGKHHGGNHYLKYARNIWPQSRRARI